MQHQYKRGLIIGRFQPLHKGHAYLIKKALENAEKIIIGIGSSNAHDKDNPYDFGEREKMVTRFIEEEGITDRVIAVVSLPDVPDDSNWLSDTLKKTGKVNVVIGNNEWVNRIFEKINTPILRVGHYKREILEGKKIRKRIREHKSWQDRVPFSIVPLADKQI